MNSGSSPWIVSENVVETGSYSVTRRKKMAAPRRRPLNLISSVRAANMVSWARGPTLLFTRKELGDFDVLKKEVELVEVRCGITSRKYGDYVGRLKIFRDGKLRITCECFDGCPADNMTLSEFEEHTKPPEGQGKWKGGFIWVFTKGGDRIPLHKTELLKYYKGSPNDSWAPRLRPRRGRTVHRNEFVKCTKCNKDRRFLLRTQLECRFYHDASLAETWTCADFPNQEISCEDDDERLAKKMLRGCPVKPLCKGCRFCVCFGCAMCRFEDCDCRSCVDFVRNAGVERTKEEN